MMIAPQIVGFLLKKPGQQTRSSRITTLDQQETKIRGEVYVEALAEKRYVSIRMGWLWVEGTSMSLPLRALNLHQAQPSICRPYGFDLGFTLSNSDGDTLATFWVNNEPVYWSWVRAIAAEIVRQTPFRALRRLNFLEILTTCPRGGSSTPLSVSPIIGERRRSRSELRCWSTETSINNNCNSNNCRTLNNNTRARSEFRTTGWSSSNSSDEDRPPILIRPWGFSEGSEGSDDSVDAPIILEQTTREQRMQRYKDARRRENEARRQKVLLEEQHASRKRKEEIINNNNNNDVLLQLRPVNNVRFQEADSNQNNSDDNINNNNCTRNVRRPGILRNDSQNSERRSRARERRIVRGNSNNIEKPTIIITTENPTNTTTTKTTVTSKLSLPLIKDDDYSEEDYVAELLEKCQRTDHYVPVIEKLTLFESLSRMGGRLARSTEDLGRSSNLNKSPKGKQRARSLHDFNRGLKQVPVREMCRFFENTCLKTENSNNLLSKTKKPIINDILFDRIRHNNICLNKNNKFVLSTWRDSTNSYDVVDG